MNVIHISIIKQTQKEYQCVCCTEPIPKGTACISAFGYDYDSFQINERIHIKPKCYKEWADMIDMIESKDIKKMIDKVMNKKC